jgi:hypothetical protein
MMYFSIISGGVLAISLAILLLVYDFDGDFEYRLVVSFVLVFIGLLIIIQTFRKRD